MRIKRIQGFSLTEMMLAFAIVGIVAAGIITAFVKTQTSSQALLDATRFDRQLTSIMNTMARDIRRAGYFAAADSLQDNPFNNSANDLRVVNGSCILLSYDINKDKKVDDVERFGYRLKDNVIQYREADGTLSCSAGTWNNLTDKYLMKITALNFKLDEVKPNDQVTVRLVAISLTGQLDNGETKTITRLVKVYNDKFTP